MLALKKQKEAIINLADFTKKMIGEKDKTAVMSKVLSLTLRLASNYKLSDLPEVQQLV